MTGYPNARSVRRVSDGRYGEDREGAAVSAIRLFVGTSANGEDYEAEAVLEYTARKHCSVPLEITWMRQAAKGPWSGWNSCKRGRTPFSAFRWSIPAVCGYQGTAIYTDVDFFFIADLAELWTQPIPHVGLVRNATGKLSTSCILFDCAAAKGHVPDLPVLRRMGDAHSEILAYFRTHTALLDRFAGNWDCSHFCKDTKGHYALDDPSIKAIHYTRIESQLHLKHAIPRLRAQGRSHWYTGDVFPHAHSELQALFDRLLVDAKAAGYTEDRYRDTGFVAATRRDFTYKHHVGAPAR